MIAGALTIGTRGSRLALAQTDLVAKALLAKNPGLVIKIKTISTKGDTNLSPIPLGAIGKTWFTKELETAILEGTIDLAVHSLKDLPVEIPKGLRMLPVLERGDPRDVLVGKTAHTIDTLPQGAIVGTDSLRRKALLLQHRPDLIVQSVRGNIETRLKKLHEGNYDALVLAASGLSRLGILDTVTEFLDPQVFIPAAGQGVLAAEARENEASLWALLNGITDEDTIKAADAEIQFTKTMGGGCKLPVGCHATLTDNILSLSAVVGSFDPLLVDIRSVKGPRNTGLQLAESLAKDFLQTPEFARLTESHRNNANT